MEKDKKEMADYGIGATLRWLSEKAPLVFLELNNCNQEKNQW